MSFPYQEDKTFQALIAHVIKSEGGYSNNPRDKGGPTAYGIAWNFNAGYLKSMFGMKNPSDIKDLTLDQARQCYYDRYWLPSGSNGLTSLCLSYVHLDTAINCGVNKAQSILGSLAKNAKNFDGDGTANRALFLELTMEYLSKRLKFYTRCKDRATFLEGWVNRVADVMINGPSLT